MRIRGVVLDFDNTLYDADRAYEYALRKVGIDPTGPSYRFARQRVKLRLGENHPSCHNRILYFKELLESEGRFSSSVLISLIDSYERELLNEISNQWDQLGRDLIISQLAQKYPLVVLTNENTRTQLLKFTRVDPEGKYFRRILTSEEFGFEKPDPRLFDFAAEALQLKPEDCLYVGDDLEKDIFPAVRAGFSTRWTLEFSKVAASGEMLCPREVKILRKLEELKDVLEC